MALKLQGHEVHQTPVARAGKRKLSGSGGSSRSSQNESARSALGHGSLPPGPGLSLDSAAAPAGAGKPLAMQLLQEFGGKAVIGDDGDASFLPLTKDGLNVLKTAAKRGAGEWDAARYDICMKALQGHTMLQIFREISKDGSEDVDTRTLPQHVDLDRELTRYVPIHRPSLFLSLSLSLSLSHTHVLSYPLFILVRLVSNKNDAIKKRISAAPTSEWALNRLGQRGPAFDAKVLPGLKAIPNQLPDDCFSWSDAAGEYINKDTLGWAELISFAQPGPFKGSTAGWDAVQARVKGEFPPTRASEQCSAAAG